MVRQSRFIISFDGFGSISSHTVWFLSALSQFPHLFFFFFWISSFFNLSITEENRLVEMRIWCIKIVIVLVLHFPVADLKGAAGPPPFPTNFWKITLAKPQIWHPKWLKNLTFACVPLFSKTFDPPVVCSISLVIQSVRAIHGRPIVSAIQKWRRKTKKKSWKYYVHALLPISSIGFTMWGEGSLLAF
jgi:hypothetical protein